MVEFSGETNSCWGRGDEERGRRKRKRGAPPGIRSENTVAPVSPFLCPRLEGPLLRRAFVNRGVKTPCKYPGFINMTWRSGAKCKEAASPPGVGSSFFLRRKRRRRDRRGRGGCHKVIWSVYLFLGLAGSLWTAGVKVDLLGTFKNNHVLGGLCVPVLLEEEGSPCCCC